jgi:hypothetical protein
MTTYALTLGVVSTTSKLFNGKSKDFPEDFKHDSTEAGNSHVLKMYGRIEIFGGLCFAFNIA